MFLFLNSCFIVVTCSIPDALPSHLSSQNNNCTSGSTIEYDSTCSFACENGYSISDSMSISCTESGALSADLPNCAGNSNFAKSFDERMHKTKELLCSNSFLLLDYK